MSNIEVHAKCRRCGVRFLIKPCALIIEYCETCRNLLGRVNDPVAQAQSNRRWQFCKDIAAKRGVKIAGSHVSSIARGSFALVGKYAGRGSR